MMKRISIYQVLPRLFDNPNCTNIPGGSLEANGSGKLEGFTSKALGAIKDLGCTHIWYTGVIEHGTKSEIAGIPGDHPDIVKGEAGSPYAIKDYYDIAPALAIDVAQRQKEFDLLVERTHSEGLGVIIDFVPNHLFRAYQSDARPNNIEDFGANDDGSVAFARDNNFYYLPGEQLTIGDYKERPARATGNDCFSTAPTPYDWYETVKLNYGIDILNGNTEHFSPVPDTWKKMLHVLTFWASRGVDGFRCDMAEMVPPAFWNWVIRELKNNFPHLIFIAEVYRPELYSTFLSAGFNYLYDKVGLYDTLIRILKGEGRTLDITNVWQAQEGWQGKLLRFMENHDEQRLASNFIAGSGEKAFPAMAVSVLFSTDPIMTYFGQELGERGMESEGYSGTDGRTTIFDYWSIRSVQEWIGKNRSYDGAELNKTVKNLRARYRFLLRFAITHPAIATGGFHDLMYANPEHTDMGLYSFARFTPEEILLIVINFRPEAQKISVRFPIQFFDHLGIKDDEVYSIRIIPTKAHCTAPLSSEKPYNLTVNGYDYTIHCFTSISR